MALWKCDKCGFSKESRCKPRKCPECGESGTFVKEGGDPACKASSKGRCKR
ncbi:rubredoxin [Thermosulfurimonas marina]|uniref:Rubredoxin n=1 Tax=Thermosulfurimonas marina TaxID=2047767 RepID=A0A6H1WT04_9BACT|nr:rubredoxin [Thermosulfurimonas marina]QJA06355.1 rubredoxin [Thermosulfurimonas marina]